MKNQFDILLEDATQTLVPLLAKIEQEMLVQHYRSGGRSAYRPTYALQNELAQWHEATHIQLMALFPTDVFSLDAQEILERHHVVSTPTSPVDYFLAEIVAAASSDFNSARFTNKAFTVEEKQKIERALQEAVETVFALADLEARDAARPVPPPRDLNGNPIPEGAFVRNCHAERELPTHLSR